MSIIRPSFAFAPRRRHALALAIGSLGIGLWPIDARTAVPTTEPEGLRYRLLHSFGDRATLNDGAAPRGELIEGSDGHLYGTTYAGGRFGLGSVFRVERRPAGTVRVRVLHSFDDSDGTLPWAPLLQGSDGNLYGTTYGSSRPHGQRGSIFRIDADGLFTALHVFRGADGAGARAGLIEASDGNFYGTTSLGGDGWGVLFCMTPGGEVTTLHAFDGPDNGGNPGTELIQASDGFLYGNTAFGGQPDLRGVLFRCSLEGTYTVVHALTFEEGEGPSSSLIETADGNKFGAAQFGGYGFVSGGTVFELAADDSFRRLYRFSEDGPLGLNPWGSLLALPDGGLLGTTQYGGQGGGGTVYRLIPAKAEPVHTFDAAFAGPKSGVLSASDGKLYGTTSAGGAFGDGTIYSLVR